MSGTTRMSRYQEGKTNLDFTEARDSEWQWHQLGHVQVCTSPHTDNHASTPPISFYRPDALPAAQPTASKHRRHQATRREEENNRNICYDYLFPVDEEHVGGDDVADDVNDLQQFTRERHDQDGGEQRSCWVRIRQHHHRYAGLEPSRTNTIRRKVAHTRLPSV